jgi:hypothetical protein
MLVGSTKSSLSDLIPPRWSSCITKIMTVVVPNLLVIQNFAMVIPPHFLSSLSLGRPLLLVDSCPAWTGVSWPLDSLAKYLLVYGSFALLTVSKFCVTLIKGNFTTKVIPEVVPGSVPPIFSPFLDHHTATVE